MSQTSINIRIDSDLEKQLKGFCSAVGMSVTTFFNICAKKTVRERKIPFEIDCVLPNDETLLAVQNVRNGENLSREFSSVKELMEDLNAED